MKNSTPRPTVLVFAGPNGSGKSTITRGMATHGTYINADDIKAEYGLTDLEAAQQAEKLRKNLLDKHSCFSFETVLSTDRNLLLLKRAKEKGYEIACIYVLTCDENINVARVKSRVASGGHDVPEDKIRSRYHRALALLPELILICDKILIFDNSDLPELVFEKDSLSKKLHANRFWSESKLESLIKL